MRSLDALARQYFRLDGNDHWNARSHGVLEAVFSAQGWPSRTIVPPRGTKVLLGYANQGPSVDVTHSIDASLRRVLRDVGRLTALPVIGIDLLVAHPTGRFDPTRDVILEVNPNPAFAMHLHPSRGRSHDLAHDIVRALFPHGAANARVPIVAGPPGCASDLRDLADRLRHGGIRTAGYVAGAAFSGTPTQSIGRGPSSVLLPTLDARADVLLFEIDDPVVQTVGVPFERVDFLLGDVDARNSALARSVRSRCGRRGSRPSMPSPRPSGVGLTPTGPSCRNRRMKAKTKAKAPKTTTEKTTKPTRTELAARRARLSLGVRSGKASAAIGRTGNTGG